ncbi:hypothetical protein [Baekduia alba]|uniref:hypothetical protein n=1 Tax=Baekduia alba TaxID=2997333 RepID=UPI002341F381|nr:hypothetical protein [Baekduia alba]
MSVDALWDEWVLAEIAAELALFLWRTAAVEERGDAYQEYVRALRNETRVAGLLARTRSSDLSAKAGVRAAACAGTP